MIDCLSNGRLISGIARGIPREYTGAQRAAGRDAARFEEAYDIITSAWTEDVFSYSGKFWSYKDVAIWPRPVQEPHPQIWTPIVGSKESIEFAGRHNIPITPGQGGGGLRDDIIRYYAKCLAAAGHRLTPNHLSLGGHAYVADSKAQAVKEAGPYHLYFNRTLFSHGNFTETALQRQAGYTTAQSTDYVRPENQRAAACCARTSATPPWPTSSAWPRVGRGERPTRWPGASSRRPTRPAPTWCRSASIAASCLTRCSSSRSAASPARCCRSCRPIASSAMPAVRGDGGLSRRRTGTASGS